MEKLWICGVCGARWPMYNNGTFLVCQCGNTISPPDIRPTALVQTARWIAEHPGTGRRKRGSKKDRSWR